MKPVFDPILGRLRGSDASGGGGGGFAIYDVTNAQRLAGTQGDGTTPLVAGDKVRVTDQANRIEQYLGPVNGAGFGNENWAVLRNTVSLGVTNYSSTEESITVNGVSVPFEETEDVGWLDPENFSAIGIQGNGFDLTHLDTETVLISGEFLLWSKGSNQWSFLFSAQPRYRYRVAFQ
jgi:hypothetical protein